MQDMQEAEIWTIARTEQGNAVLLRPIGSDLVVPLLVGEVEAQAILIGFGEVPFPRPLIYDLFLDMLHQTGYMISQVEVHDIREGIFYSRLILSGGEAGVQKRLVLDAQPSDALALAVRYKCPVLIAPSVVEKAGLSADRIINAVAEGQDSLSAAVLRNKPSGKPQESRAKARQNAFQKELNEVLSQENYERAAEIRDILHILEKQDGKSAPSA